MYSFWATCTKIAKALLAILAEGIGSSLLYNLVMIHKTCQTVGLERSSAMAKDG